MIFSDLPSPAEASSRIDKRSRGLAQAGNRGLLFGIMRYRMESRARRVEQCFRRMANFRRRHGALGGAVVGIEPRRLFGVETRGRAHARKLGGLIVQPEMPDQSRAGRLGQFAMVDQQPASLGVLLDRRGADGP